MSSNTGSSEKVWFIGVSNFLIKILKALLQHVTVVPATNQGQCHPCLPQLAPQRYCEEEGILLTAHSLFGEYLVMPSV
jgi:glycerol 2-dehydrogenase (NADP+)